MFKKGHKINLGKHWKVKDTSKMGIKKGTKLSAEQRRKNIKILNQYRLKGEKCHFWKGGITPENQKIRHSIEYRLWREAVFARDNWICQKCKKRGGKIDPHHIQNFAQFSELRFAIDNGITLCRNCHKEFHKKYGQRNNTKEQLIRFIG